MGEMEEREGRGRERGKRVEYGEKGEEGRYVCKIEVGGRQREEK